MLTAAQQFSSDFAAIIESGGHNFTQIIASGFKQSVGEGVDILSKFLVGTPGDPKKSSVAYLPDGTPYLANQQIGQMYDPQGNNITGRSQNAQLGLAGAQDLLSGYQGARSGQSNSVLTGALSGAAAGVAFAGESYGISIVVGAIVGMIGAELGKQAARADYKYGIPTIDQSGVAHFGQTQNYTDAAALQVTRQIQGIYDSIHDSLAMILIKAGALVPITQGINGKFQDNPSGHYEEHLQQFLTGTLPSNLMGQFKDELTNLAGTFGMSAARFSEIWAFLQNVDPTKAVGLLGTMFGALGDPNSSLNPNSEQYRVQHYDNAMIGFNPSSQMLGNLDYRSQMNPGQIIHEMDAEILNLANGLKGMSPEGQINAIAQIDSLNKQRYQAEIQLATQLWNLVKQIDAQTEASVKNFEAQKILKDDGTPDQFGLSQFYKQNADKDLRDLQNAKNADQESAAWAKFQQDVQQAEQFGYAQDPTKAGKQAWAQWGIDNMKLGQTIADQIAASIGMSLNPEQAAFNAKFDPLIDLFKNGITKLFNPGDGTGGSDPNDPDHNPINKANALLAGNTNAAAASLSILAPSVNTVATQFASLSQAMSDFEERVNSSGFGNTGRSSASGFIARTQASRAA